MNQKGLGEIDVIAFLLLVGVIVSAFAFWFFPTYGIWAAEQHGKSELANAEYSKRVAVETAKAKKDSAQFEAEAEVARADGVAKANHIIGDSLKGKEEYLRYLYITKIGDSGNKEIIYIPTEAGIPILEASRFNQLAQPQK